VPAFNPPHREIKGLTPENRIELIRAAIKPYTPELELDTQEIDRGGTSYTIKTLQALGKKYKKENMYFIMGSDAFQGLPQWKDYVELLKLSNFVITSRPGTFLTLASSDLPPGLNPLVKSEKSYGLLLKSGRQMISMELEDIDASATEIRKRIRAGHVVKQWLPESVLKIIEDRGFFKRTSPLVSDYRDFAIFCAKTALDKKAIGVKIYDMSKKNSYADYSVICSATSNRHAASIADNIAGIVKEEIGLSPLSKEGEREGLWVLLDFGAVVVHIFQDHVRDQYKIENLWKDCPQIQNEIKSDASTHSRSVETRSGL
jgi:nicotinate (nicotinamide) nucleotide adenylyltransferase/ribosome silencing factor RsfS/YbeB/iojap